MTKAEQKKIEKQSKLDFLAKTYGIILSGIAEHIADIRSKVKFCVTQTNFNRYIRFQAYGQELTILIYKDGKVVLELKEALHNDHSEILFDYEEGHESLPDFYEKLKEIMPRLIRVFLDYDVHDFHSYMDYISETHDAALAYQRMHDEYDA